MKKLSELNVPGLKLICGADAEVESIGYAADSSAFCCGASMIITCGTAFNTQKPYELFQNLAANGTRALLVVGLEMADVERYIKEAGRFCISIIAAESNCILSELAQSLAMQLWNIPQPEKKKNENITDLIDAPDIESILHKLASCAETACACRDSLKMRTYHSDASHDFIEKVKTYPHKEISRLFTTYPILGDGVEYGHLIFESPPSCSKNTLNAALLGLKFIARKDLFQRINDKMRFTKLFEELKEGNIREQSELLHKLRSVGIRKDGPCAVMLFENDATTGENEQNRINVALDTLKKSLSPYFDEIYFYIKAPCIVGIFMPSDNSGTKYRRNSFEKPGEAVCRELHRLFPSSTVYCSLGELRDTLVELGQCYNTALYALRYAKLHSLPDRIVKWDELGSFKILNEIAMCSESVRFCGAKLGKLKEFDELHGGSLLVTLSELYANNWKFQQTAKNMSYHLNTVKYRYRKICEILNADIENDYELRFDLQLALKLREIYDVSPKGEY